MRAKVCIENVAQYWLGSCIKVTVLLQYWKGPGMGVHTSINPLPTAANSL